MEKPYQWANGATLEEHSRRKLTILREYVFDYLSVRCRLPQQERFRLAIVDGFAGGGRYEDGTPGSPLIFIEELKRAVPRVARRAVYLPIDDEGKWQIALTRTLELLAFS